MRRSTTTSTSRSRPLRTSRRSLDGVTVQVGPASRVCNNSMICWRGLVRFGMHLMLLPSIEHPGLRETHRASDRPAAATIGTGMAAERAFVGGMRGPRGANASWPLARLTLDPSKGVIVGLRRALSWLPFLSAMHYAWVELDRAEEVR